MCLAYVRSWCGMNDGGANWLQRLSQNLQSCTGAERGRQVHGLSGAIRLFSFLLSIPVILGHLPRGKPRELTSSMDSRSHVVLFILAPDSSSHFCALCQPFQQVLWNSRSPFPPSPTLVCHRSFLLFPYHTEMQLVPKDTRF